MGTAENATEDALLKSQRHQRILEMLRVSGQVHAAALGEAFGVSNYTIRRDLDELSEAGLLKRVHGGAVLASHVPRTYDERKQSAVREKKLSAGAAASLLKPDDVAIIDGGSTAAALIQVIPQGFPATFITHSPQAATDLLARSVREVVLLGGRMDSNSRVCVGAATVAAYSEISADICYLGLWGLTINGGVTSPFYDEALVRTAMVQAAHNVVGLAVAAKLGTGGAFTVAPASALTHLSLEPGVPDDVVRPFREVGVKIVSERPD
jgi:DeoR/GlpR family transcriptional regulator of sugar metabolism